MVKNRYLVISVALLLMLLITIIVIMPKSNIEVINPNYTYVDKVFDQSKVTSVDILMDDSALEEMMANPLAEQYVMASVVVNGVEVKHVGVRTKGNSSLSSVARDADTNRYSFKIDFDYYDDVQSLYGLKKLNLNNNFSDSTFMREYLSYELMGDMEVPAPANSYMYVTINGEDWGLYIGVETIDETFLARNFPEGTGDLYKPDGNNLSYISDVIEDYNGLVLKTNEKTSNQSAIIQMLDVINNGGNIEDVLDVDEMLRYFAINTALVSLDSYQGNFMHNFYLYEENGVFQMLPWDYNMSFGGFGGFGGGAGRGQVEGEVQGQVPVQGGGQGRGIGQGQGEFAEAAPDGMPDNTQGAPLGGVVFGGGGMEMSSNFMSDSNINFSIVSPVSGSTLESRPLLNALLSVDEYREKYNQYLEEIAKDYFDEETMQQKTMEISSLIMEYVEKDPTKFSTTEQFIEGVSGENSLVQFAAKRADSILAQLSGELVVEADTGDGFGGQGDMGNMGMPPNGNMEFPDRGGQRSDGEGFVPGDLANIPNIPDGKMRPDGAGGPNAPEGMGRFGGRGGPGDAEQVTEANESYSSSTISTYSICVIVLIGFIIFAAMFKRRRSISH